MLRTITGMMGIASVPSITTTDMGTELRRTVIHWVSHSR